MWRNDTLLQKNGCVRSTNSIAFPFLPFLPPSLSLALLVVLCFVLLPPSLSSLPVVCVSGERSPPWGCSPGEWRPVAVPICLMLFWQLIAPTASWVRESRQMSEVCPLPFFQVGNSAVTATQNSPLVAKIYPNG